MGLIGLLTCQLLLAHGCRVLGIDPDQEKCALAESFGVSTFTLVPGSDPVDWCLDKTSSVGVDGVVIAASTKSSDPVHIAAESCRQRGRIVMVGVTGLELRRDLFYKKEITFRLVAHMDLVAMTHPMNSIAMTTLLVLFVGPSNVTLWLCCSP